MLDDFGHLRKNRHTSRRKQLRERLRTSACLRITKRRIECDCDEFRGVNPPVRRLCGEIDFEHALDLVAKEIKSHRGAAAGRTDVDNSAAHRNFAWRLHCIDARVAAFDEPRDKFCGRHPRTGLQCAHQRTEPCRLWNCLHERSDRRDNRRRYCALGQAPNYREARNRELRARAGFPRQDFDRGEEHRINPKRTQFLDCVIGLVEMRHNKHCWRTSIETSRRGARNERRQTSCGSLDRAGSTAREYALNKRREHRGHERRKCIGQATRLVHAYAHGDEIHADSRSCAMVCGPSP